MLILLVNTRRPIMAEGLKLVNDIFDRARRQRGVPWDAYLGIDVAVLVLSDPQNADLWKRMVEYCGLDTEKKKEPC